MTSSGISNLAASQGNDLTTWIALCIGGLALVYIFMRPKPKKPDLPAAMPRFNPSTQRNVEKEMETLLVELSKMARQITAQLDTRAIKLELLIKDADQRIARLAAMANPDKQAGEAVPAIPIEPPVTQSPGVETAASEPAAADQAPSDPLPPSPDNRHAEVYSLSDEGNDANEIARQLGRPFGEIQLILALRRSSER